MRRFKIMSEGNKSLCATGLYEKIYTSGESMIIDDDTFGFILFDNIPNLIKFVQHFLAWNTLTNLKCPLKDRGMKLFIAEVETIGDEFIPDALCCSSQSKYLDKFYSTGELAFTMIPKGTICCKEIEVLNIQPLYKHLV